MVAEFLKEVEAGFAHDAEDFVTGVFGCDLEAAGDVMGGEFVDVTLVAGLGFGRGAFFVEEEVVADAAGDVGVLDALGFPN